MIDKTTKYFAIAIALSFAIGSYFGYLVAYTMFNDSNEIAVTVQTELEKLSSKISTLHYSTNDSDHSKQIIQRQDNLSTNDTMQKELTEVIRDTLKAELTPILSGFHKNNQRIALQDASHSEPETIRADIESVNVIISSAISSGFLDDNSVQDFNKILQKLPKIEQEKAYSKLLTAINNGEIKLDNPMILFH